MRGKDRPYPDPENVLRRPLTADEQRDTINCRCLNGPMPTRPCDRGYAHQGGAYFRLHIELAPLKSAAFLGKG